MTIIQDKASISDKLKALQASIHQTIETMPEDKLYTGTETEWSPADYLKHIIISVKSFAKGLHIPKDQLGNMFGKSENGSMTYDELVALYDGKIDAGMKAEMAPNITPMNYRMPEDIEDVRAYLLETWNNANQRLIDALEDWSEDDLDIYQLPHPATGPITMRDMYFFTIHHNELHGEDIKRGGQ